MGKIETTGHEPFAPHAPIQWAMNGDVIKNRGGLSDLVVPESWAGESGPVGPWA